MDTFGSQPFSLMRVLGKYQATAGISNTSNTLMNTHQNQMNFMGHLGGPLKSDTINFSALAKADKQAAMSNVTNKTKLAYYQAMLKALENNQK